MLTKESRSALNRWALPAAAMLLLLLPATTLHAATIAPDLQATLTDLDASALRALNYARQAMGFTVFSVLLTLGGIALAGWGIGALVGWPFLLGIALISVASGLDLVAVVLAILGIVEISEVDSALKRVNDAEFTREYKTKTARARNLLIGVGVLQVLKFLVLVIAYLALLFV